jgi:succinate dehydrogenase / fumarate reductase iron-sulfur subunit
MSLDVALRVLRFDPETDSEPHFEEFTVQAEPMDRLLDCLHFIKWHQDSSLALRRSCGHGICGSDAMVVNGVNRLACKELVKDLEQPVTVEPIRGLPIIKDLVVDMEPFFEGYRAVKPWLIAKPGEHEPERERLQSPDERERFDDTTKCILCAACTTSCPIFWADGGYVGPAAIVNAHRFIFDSRDRGSTERLRILSERAGVYKCRTVFNCTDACPRGIKVTKAIQEVKRAALFGSQ